MKTILSSKKLLVFQKFFYRISQSQKLYQENYCGSTYSHF